jgi:hypothetical protein
MRCTTIIALLPGLLPLCLYFSCTILEHTNPYDPQTTFDVIVREAHDMIMFDQTVPSDFNENNPLIVTNWLQIQAKLTIEPGVHMRFQEQAGLELAYRGLIRAVGTEDAPIVFTNDAPTHRRWRGITITADPADTNIFEYCHFAWDSITISGDVRFVNCVFDNCSIDPLNFPGSMLFKGCRFIFTNLYFHDGTTGSTIDSCFLEMSNITVKNKPSFRMHNCHARSLTAQNVELDLTNNIFLENIQTQISMLNNCSGVISYNVFDKATTAIYLRTIQDNDQSLHSMDNSVEITNNNFLTIDDYAISLKIIGSSGETPQASTVNASDNYWGTADTARIRALIYDTEDDMQFCIGAVRYLPFLTSPVDNAGPNW